MQRRDLRATLNEFTTQKIRQEWAEQEQILGLTEEINTVENTYTKTESVIETDSKTVTVNQTDAQKECDINCDTNTLELSSIKADIDSEVKEDSKSKKKRRKKSVMKRRSSVALNGSQYISNRKGSSSSNSVDASEITNDTELNQSNSTSNDASPKSDVELPLQSDPSRISDFHFFSDTEAASGLSPRCSRPPTPIKSDTEFEILKQHSENDIMTTSASWKWGELPSPAPQLEVTSDQSISDEAKQAQRLSMLSNMFSFMKQAKSFRKNSQEGVYLSDLDVEGLDPEVEALYFPPISPINHIDDHESGNGTSLPHSPSSIESPKSVDSDYEEGKYCENRSGIALSLCGGLENGDPTDFEFNQHIIEYTEVMHDDMELYINIFNYAFFSKF